MTHARLEDAICEHVCAAEREGPRRSRSAERMVCLLYALQCRLSTVHYSVTCCMSCLALASCGVQSGHKLWTQRCHGERNLSNRFGRDSRNGGVNSLCLWPTLRLA